MTNMTADTPTSLAARHARLESDLNAMQTRYPLQPRPVSLPQEPAPHNAAPLPPRLSRKEQKAASAAEFDRRASRHTAKVGAVLLVILYLVVCGIVANIRWIFF